MSVTIDQLKAVFLAALEKAAAADRTAFLDEACAADAALRHGVEALLRAHDRADPLLDRPAADHLEPAGERAAPDDSLGFLDPPSRPGSLGRLGHYEVLEVLGRGGFGIVLRAFDDRLQRVVAIKVLAPQLAVTSPARKRFLREARSAARVRHENVVQVYAVEEQPLPYLVMEFIPGETLQQRLDRKGPLETAEAVRIGRQIAEGLAAAHAQGLIHRDIKPGNILLEAGPNPHVKITDFGLARTADDASMTQSGIVAGTPLFMSPEQASGDTLDHRADLFSLGSVLYAMATGRPPFRARTSLAVLRRVAEDTPRPIPEINPEVPPWLCDLITRLHAKRPEDRIGTAREVADLLGRGLAEMESHVERNSFRSSSSPSNGINSVPRTPAIKPRFRTGRWAAAAAVLLLLGGLGLTEATGVTKLRGTVIRLFSPDGTLVVEVDDPDVSVKIDGSEIVITGAGAREIRLKPGSYTVEASKGGKLVRRELVTVTKNGRQVVRVSQEAAPSGTKAAKPSADVSVWERSVAAMPAAQQVKVVVARLRERNPNFDGKVTPTIKDGVVTGLEFHTRDVSDISPLRALTKLSSLNCSGTNVSDLSPLKDLKLTYLACFFTQVTDLAPLKDMKLTHLDCGGTKVSDLTLLEGMPLARLVLSGTKVTDLTPLKGMPLTLLGCSDSQVTDLSPLKGLPLAVLWCNHTAVSDLTPLKEVKLRALEIKGTRVTDLSPLRAIPTLQSINGKPVAQFWKETDAKTKD